MSLINRPRRALAFTLIELIVVMGIIVIVASLLLTPASTILRGSKLTQASDMMVSNLTLGRKAAISNNCQMEVRLYQYGDPSIAGQQVSQPSGGNYRAMQLLAISPSGAANAFGKVELLPTTIIMDSNAMTLSTLLATPLHSPTVPIPQAGTSYNRCAFRFLPDGSTNLSPTAPYWTVTLHNLVNGDNLSSPPPNYATIQIDPISGSMTTYRP